MRQGHEVSKCWWKMVPIRLAHHGAAVNLQFAKNTLERSPVRTGRPVSPPIHKDLVSEFRQ